MKADRKESGKMKRKSRKKGKRIAETGIFPV